MGSAHCARTLRSAHRAPHTAHRTLHTAHRTPHTAHCTLRRGAGALHEVAVAGVGPRSHDVVQHGLGVGGVGLGGPVARARLRPAEPQPEEVGAVAQRAAREGRAPAARLEVAVAPAVQLLVRRHAEAHHLKRDGRRSDLSRPRRREERTRENRTRYSWQHVSTVTQNRWKAALSTTQASQALHCAQSCTTSSGAPAPLGHSARKYSTPPHSIQQHITRRLTRKPMKY